MSDVPGKVITIERLASMFNNIKENTNWDLDNDMLWGYFFIHNEPKLLEKAATKLQAQAYKVVRIFMAEKDEAESDKPDKYWLHVEKIETHTPASLDKRNDELYIFAHENGLDSYDGMHISPVDK